MVIFVHFRLFKEGYSLLFWQENGHFGRVSKATILVEKCLAIFVHFGFSKEGLSTLFWSENGHFGRVSKATILVEKCLILGRLQHFVYVGKWPFLSILVCLRKAIALCLGRKMAIFVHFGLSKKGYSTLFRSENGHFCPYWFV